MLFLVDPVHCSRDPQTSLFNKTFIKNGSTALFIHLKIILLQYFQFLVFNSIQIYPKCAFGMDEICQLILLFS